MIEQVNKWVCNRDLTYQLPFLYLEFNLPLSKCTQNWGPNLPCLKITYLQMLQVLTFKLVSSSIKKSLLESKDEVSIFKNFEFYHSGYLYTLVSIFLLLKNYFKIITLKANKITINN